MSAAHEDEAAEAQATLNELSAELKDSEVRWRDKQKFLKLQGYMLRPRYNPDWIPSWTVSGKSAQECEDSIRLPLRPNLIDATRIADGKLVYIKRVKTGGNEYNISKLLSEERHKHAANHCVPILEILLDDEDATISYLVMPFLRLTDTPPFERVDDIVDLADQLFEGLNFMHSRGVAHRDCAYKNLMMDGSSLYPGGFHPVRSNLTPDTRSRARPYSRFTAPRPVKYYYVDFGISSIFSPEDKSRLVVGADGIDQEVPELSDTVPYDPFKVDIFVLGDFFKLEVLPKFSNVDFLIPFIESMTSQNPADRPDATTVLQRWKAIKREFTLWQRTQPLQPRDRAHGNDTFQLWPFLNFGPLVLRRGLMFSARFLRVIR